MLLPIMTFNIQHGVDFNRRDRLCLRRLPISMGQKATHRQPKNCRSFAAY